MQMKKVISIIMGLAILFGATTQAGATSTAGTTTNVLNSKTQTTALMKNHNSYEVGMELQPQKLKNGKWVNLGWHSYNFIKAYKNGKDIAYKKDFSAGTFRYKVTVDKFDKDGNAVKKGQYYTATFKY